MATTDPLGTLGLDAEATVEQIHVARRRLAKQHHPDRGGDAEYMQIINEAADAALVAIGADASAPSPDSVSSPTTSAPEGEPGVVARDVPSFTVEALPAETFEAMLVVASWLGEVLDDDPPYRLDTYLSEPFDCWCRLDVVPDAGASTVSLSVAGLDGTPAPDVVAVRDAWVANLNAVDWM
jgi:hypothetical protein